MLFVGVCLNIVCLCALIVCVMRSYCLFALYCARAFAARLCYWCVLHCVCALLFALLFIIFFIGGSWSLISNDCFLLRPFHAKLLLIWTIWNPISNDCFVVCVSVLSVICLWCPNCVILCVFYCALLNIVCLLNNVCVF